MVGEITWRRLALAVDSKKDRRDKSVVFWARKTEDVRSDIDIVCIITAAVRRQMDQNDTQCMR